VVDLTQLELTDAAAVLGWLAVILGVRRAVFGSMLAQELGRWWTIRNAPKTARVAQLKWCLRRGIEWNEAIARGDKLTAASRLTDDRRREVIAELQGLARPGLFWRAAGFLAACGFCQAFWICLAIGLATGLAAWPAIATAAGMAAMATMIPHRGENAARGGCQGKRG
jgi:hypothetical protein